MTEPTQLRPVGSLKPCPFDGGKRLVIFRTPRYDLETHPGWADDPDAFAYNVHCTSCAADGPWKKSQSAAEQFWNGIPGTERGGLLPQLDTNSSKRQFADDLFATILANMTTGDVTVVELEGLLFTPSRLVQAVQHRARRHKPPIMIFTQRAKIDGRPVELFFGENSKFRSRPSPT